MFVSRSLDGLRTAMVFFESMKKKKFYSAELLW